VKIVADENIDQQIVDRLRSEGHEVLFIAELDPGIDDDAVLLKSRESNAVLVTADKDFGELIFRQHHAPLGSHAYPARGSEIRMESGACGPRFCETWGRVTAGVRGLVQAGAPDAKTVFVIGRANGIWNDS
jgi:hypothetical protein